MRRREGREGSHYHLPRGLKPSNPAGPLRQAALSSVTGTVGRGERVTWRKEVCGDTMTSKASQEKKLSLI